MSMVRTLRSAADIVDAELLPAKASDLARLDDLERVAARYAVAITPAMAELIDAADPHDPIARAVPARSGGARSAAGGARRSDWRRRA